METKKTSINKATIVRTNKVLFDHVHVDEPWSFNGKNDKFSITLRFSKDDKKNEKIIMDAVKAAYEKGKRKWMKDGQEVPELTAINSPLHDGDEDRPEDSDYHGYYFINASSSRKPEIFDVDKKKISDAKVIRTDDIGRAVLSFYPYEFDGSYGVGCGLEMLQKIENASWFPDFPAGADDPDDDNKEEM